MKVTREVILDLLPAYIAGEASLDTRALVDEYLKQDAELEQRVRAHSLESLATEAASSTTLRTDVEMQSLRRTRSLLGWQRRLFGWALGLSCLSLSTVFYYHEGHFSVHLLVRDFPAVLVPCMILAASCWINYLVIRRRLRTTLG